MPTITKQQMQQLESDEGYMRQSGLPQADIEAYRESQLRKWGVFEAAGEPAALDPTGESGRKQFFQMMGPLAGGLAGSGMAARSGQLVQTLAEGAGIALGDIGQRAATGEPQDIKASTKLGVGGASLGYGFRAATRLMGSMAGVPRYATEEAGVPTVGLPSYQKVGLTPGSSPGPRNVGQLAKGISAEETLADRARSAVGKLVSKFTPERLRKTQLLQQAGKQGAKVDMQPIVMRLIDQEIPNAVTDAAKAHNAAIGRTVDELTDMYNRKQGFLTPVEADEIIRKQLDPKAYTSSGDPSTTSIGVALREVRDIAVEELNKALPPEVAKLNKQISVKLDAMDEAESLFGGDRSGVVNRIRNLYNPGNEDNIRAMNFLAKESGDRRLASKVLKTSAKREFTTDIRTPSETRGRPIRTIVESGAKQITRAAAPLQPYAGPAIAGRYPDFTKSIAEREKAAMEYFYSAMNPRNNP